MIECDCRHPHEQLRIVITGGPGAGKTAVLELVRQHFCRHVDVLPEAASTLFLGGFRRGVSLPARMATQRAIFHVQRELEAVAEGDSQGAIVLCDRGTIDGYAYWPTPATFFSELGINRRDELARYHAVIHLRTPGLSQGYNLSNPARIETLAEALAIDERIVSAWDGHPRRYFIKSSDDFMSKAQRAIEVLRGELPMCCKSHVVPTSDRGPTVGADRSA